MAKFFLKLALTAILLTGLTGSALAARVTVFAAASLTNALQDIAKQYQQETGDEVVLSFASSSTLARQIEAGAPANVFISADQKWMDYLQEKQGIDTTSRKTLLANSLVVIVPESSKQQPVTIDARTDWNKLLQGGRLAVGDPDHVPVGIYMKQAMQQLGAWDNIADKLAPAQDVRSGLALVERNEVPIGVVYSSDAQVTPKVKIIGHFPPESYPKVEYPLALISDHDNPDSRRFYNYLQQATATAVFQRYGFVTQPQP